MRQFLRNYQRPTQLRHFRINNKLLRNLVWPVAALLMMDTIIELNYFGLKKTKITLKE